jgi:hypothetical protein
VVQLKKRECLVVFESKYCTYYFSFDFTLLARMRVRCRFISFQEVKTGPSSDNLSVKRAFSSSKVQDQTYIDLPSS